MSHQLNRRSALALGLLAPASALAASGQSRSSAPFPRALAAARPPSPVVVASGNGLPATQRAMEMLLQGADPADAIVAGVTIVENDPSDMSVGLGGIPNEECVVQLDASVMHGPTHKSGAVACIERIKNPAAVALLVLKRTDHVLLVGDGARRFALAHGFAEENLLTDEARKAWLRWKENANPNDDWLDRDQMDWESDQPRNQGTGPIGSAQSDPFLQHLRRANADAHVHWRNGIPYTTGTINCCAVDAAGNVASCTTTSGLSYKIPGRVGDSPICGAGMYCDNDVGAAGATGRGEAVAVNCGGFAVVRAMERGLTPTEACVEVLRSIVAKTREKRLRSADGKVNFDVKLYAVRKDGLHGSASIMPNATYAVHDGQRNRLEPCASIYT